MRFEVCYLRGGYPSTPGSHWTVDDSTASNAFTLEVVTDNQLYSVGETQAASVRLCLNLLFELRINMRGPRASEGLRTGRAEAHPSLPALARLAEDGAPPDAGHQPMTSQGISSLHPNAGQGISSLHPRVQAAYSELTSAVGPLHQLTTFSPDPELPLNPELIPRKKAVQRQSKKAPPKTPAPDTLELTDELRAWVRATTPHVDVQVERVKFLQYCRAQRIENADWVEAFKSWLVEANRRSRRLRVALVDPVVARLQAQRAAEPLPQPPPAPVATPQPSWPRLGYQTLAGCTKGLSITSSSTGASGVAARYVLATSAPSLSDTIATFRPL